METEINVSVAIIEPHIGLFSRTKAVNKQVASVAKAKPDLIILPRYTMKVDELLEAYDAAKKFKPNIAMFSQTQYPQRIDPLAPGDLNPLSRLKYEVSDLPYKGREDANLDALFLFCEGKIEPTQSIHNSVRPGGYLIMLDNLGNHMVLYRHVEGKEPGFNVSENLEKKMKNCSLYDLKF